MTSHCSCIIQATKKLPLLTVNASDCVVIAKQITHCYTANIWGWYFLWFFDEMLADINAFGLHCYRYANVIGQQGQNGSG